MPKAGYDRNPFTRFISDVDSFMYVQYFSCIGLCCLPIYCFFSKKSHHPNVASYIGLSIDPTDVTPHICLVTERYTGQTLRSLLR